MGNVDVIIVNGVKQVVESGGEMTEPWNGERARSESSFEEQHELQPVDPPWNAGGVLIVHVTESEVDGNTVYTCDKTAGEIYAAMSNGGVVFSYTQISGAAAFELCIVAEYEDGDGYTFASSKYFNGDGLVGELWAATANDYPTGTSTST